MVLLFIECLSEKERSIWIVFLLALLNSPASAPDVMTCSFNSAECVAQDLISFVFFFFSYSPREIFHSKVCHSCHGLEGKFSKYIKTR